MEQIFELLKLHHIISIVLGFILSGFLAWLFRDVIEDYLRKKYELYKIETGKFAGKSRRGHRDACRKGNT